jgi:hypothetical protein
LARRPRPCLSRGSSIRKYYMPTTVRFIGFTARPPRALFPALASVFMADRPLMLYAPASSFRTVCPPQSSFTTVPARVPKIASTTYQGFGPICGITGGVHLPRGFPAPRYVPPTGFLSLPAVCSAPQLFRLISSRKPHPGFACTGIFPFGRPYLPFGRQFLHTVGAQLLTARRRWPAPRASASRS